MLLWWKAWDPEGAPGDACVRDPDGTPLALDPESAAGRALIEDAMAHMLGPDGLDADGLKIDFTARTPSGTRSAARRAVLGLRPAARAAGGRLPGGEDGPSRTR